MQIAKERLVGKGFCTRKTFYDISRLDYFTLHLTVRRVSQFGIYPRPPNFIAVLLRHITLTTKALELHLPNLAYHALANVFLILQIIFSTIYRH